MYLYIILTHLGCIFAVGANADEAEHIARYNGYIVKSSALAEYDDIRAFEEFGRYGDHSFEWGYGKWVYMWTERSRCHETRHEPFIMI